MKKICKERLPIVRSEKPRAEAIAYMQEKNEPYKVELINDLPEDAVISFYTQGDFTDLCAGPHLDHTGRVKHNGFKLLNSCGAYWRGDSNRKMLQRIYGIAFQSKEELETYLQRIEEAKKRDHRRLGKELGLFMLTDYGPGFPFFLPKGMVLRNTLIDYWRQVHKKYGYVEVSTPMILNRTLWEQSGHWDHYKNNMYTTPAVCWSTPVSRIPTAICPCGWANWVWCTVMSCPARSTACSASGASPRTMPTSS